MGDADVMAPKDPEPENKQSVSGQLSTTVNIGYGSGEGSIRSAFLIGDSEWPYALGFPAVHHKPAGRPDGAPALPWKLGKSSWSFGSVLS